VPRKVTPEQLEEILRCKEDALYFLTQYLWLKHTTKGKIKWDKPYPYQAKLIQDLQRGENVFVCKSRRVGASWVSCAFAMWKAMFFPDQQILILSQKQFSAIGLLTRIRFMYDNLPDWLKTPTSRNSRQEIAFVFRYGGMVAESVINSLSTTDRSGAGEDASVVVMDEAAFIEHADDVWAAVGPTAAFGGQRVVVSTPGGTGGFFYRMVSQLRLGVELGFVYIEAHWKRDCGLTDEWYEKATVGLSTQKRLQEFELAFLQTGFPFFDLMKLKNCYKPLDKHPEILDMAQPSQVNFSGVDTSNGVPRQDQGEPDYHSIVTINDKGVQIYAFNSNKMPLKDFAGQTVHGDDGKMYHVPGVPTKVHKEFPGIMCFERWSTGDVVLSRHVAPDDGYSETKGFRTTNSSKMRILNDIRMAINSEAITITDPFTYQCFCAFEDQSTGIIERAGAAKGCYDDPVMSFAMAWREYRRWSGFQYDFSDQEMMSGQRMVALNRTDDLSPEALQKVLSVGNNGMVGPITDANPTPTSKDPGVRSQLDDFDAVRSGRKGHRRERVRSSRMR